MSTLTALAGRTSSLRLPKIDARLVVGLLLVALSVLGGLRLAAGSDQSVAVYAAAKDVRTEAAIFRLPFVGDVWPSLSVPVEATHAVQIDRYRSGS